MATLINVCGTWLLVPYARRLLLLSLNIIDNQFITMIKKKREIMMWLTVMLASHHNEPFASGKKTSLQVQLYPECLHALGGVIASTQTSLIVLTKCLFH